METCGTYFSPCSVLFYCVGYSSSINWGIFVESADSDIMSVSAQVNWVGSVDNPVEPSEGYATPAHRRRVEGGVWEIQTVSRVQIVSFFLFSFVKMAIRRLCSMYDNGVRCVCGNFKSVSQINIQYSFCIYDLEYLDRTYDWRKRSFFHPICVTYWCVTKYIHLILKNFYIQSYPGMSPQLVQSQFMARSEVAR